MSRHDDLGQQLSVILQAYNSNYKTLRKLQDKIDDVLSAIMDDFNENWKNQTRISDVEGKGFSIIFNPRKDINLEELWGLYQRIRTEISMIASCKIVVYNSMQKEIRFNFF